MHTPDVNHRFAGWRESVKIVSHTKGALADIVEQSAAAEQLAVDYDTLVEPAIIGSDSESVIDTAQSTIQRVRVVLDFYRRRF